MRRSHSGVVALMIALACGLLVGLWKLYDLRFNAGDIYPPYSSLRSDPLGARALYESLRGIPGLSIDRNYREFASLPKQQAAILFLGENPSALAFASADELKEYEALAAGAARVVIAMRPVRAPKEDSSKPDAKKPTERSSIEERWGVHFAYTKAPAKPDEEKAGANPKTTALYFEFQGKVLDRVERPFGSGSVVLLANSYPLSNEALAGERDARLIAWMIGSNHKVVFDEHQFGVTESSGVVTLAQKFHLEGLAAVLLVLLALFIWKNSTSLLPPRAERSADDDDSVAAKDSSSGLANLLRRNIPSKALMAACLNEWENSGHGGKFYSQNKIDQIRALIRRDGDAVETYRKAARILSERSNG